MAVHSFSEGIAIGVSFRRSSPPQLGMLVTTTLAVHNVPEGFAVSVPLMSKGMSTLDTALWSVATRCGAPNTLFHRTTLAHTSSTYVRPSVAATNFCSERKPTCTQYYRKFN